MPGRGVNSFKLSPGDVGEITMLKRQPRSEEALQLLRKIHSLVKPIMKKHGWYLPTLSEFFPKNPGLLGVNINGGQKICIRLRPAHDPNSFLDLEGQLIGTMLHELTHNVRGPHDQIFYKQLDELQDEYDALRTSGYSGEGFLGDGNRVGLGHSHDNLTPAQAREKALKKFEERDKLQRLLGKGGILGGQAPDMKGKRIGDVLADAAERRMRDAKTCGGGDSHDHPSGSKREDLPPDVLRAIEESERDSKTVTIDLTKEDGDDPGPVAGPSSLRTTPDTRSDEKETTPPTTNYASSDSDIEVIVPARRPAPAPVPTPKPSASSSAPPRKKRATPTTAWTCPTCTYNNVSPLSLACEMCFTERPSSISATMAVAEEEASSSRYTPVGMGGTTVELEDGWICHQCSTLTQHSFWTCSACGTVKQSSTRG